MLTYQKNKLINLLLQFEIIFNKETDEIEKIQLKNQGEADDMMNKFDIIHRNIQSIKKTINKL